MDGVSERACALRRRWVGMLHVCVHLLCALVVLGSFGFLMMVTLAERGSRFWSFFGHFDRFQPSCAVLGPFIALCLGGARLVRLFDD